VLLETGEGLCDVLPDDTEPDDDALGCLLDWVARLGLAPHPTRAGALRLHLPHQGARQREPLAPCHKWRLPNVRVSPGDAAVNSDRR